MSAKRSERWLHETGENCIYDGSSIEYTDAVITLFVVKPYIEQGTGGLRFYNLQTDEQDDFLYEPGFFHSYNWEFVEEKLQELLGGKEGPKAAGSIVDCWFCQSGILAGETMGIATLGELIRSQRNPDLRGYGNHFENLDRSPRYLCISCLFDLNTEVIEVWGAGVCHEEECEDGLRARCWRSGCPGNCPKKLEEEGEDEEDEEDEDDE